MKRIFIAIPLPDNIRQQLGSISSLSIHPAVRWTPAQNLHVTVHFIGATPEENISIVQEKILKATSEEEIFNLSMQRLEVIYKKRSPVMLWARLNKNESFHQLSLKFQREFPGENIRKPIPHITLARIKESREFEIPQLPKINFEWTVTGVELMESELNNSFPVYRLVQRFELKPN